MAAAIADSNVGAKLGLTFTDVLICCSGRSSRRWGISGEDDSVLMTDDYAGGRSSFSIHPGGPEGRGRGIFRASEN